jgi:H+/Cl- antiporter ClcA
VLAFAGAFATLSTAFGGPLPSALLLFEIVATSGRFPSAMLGRLLLPGFVAAGTGALVFTGIGDWAGVQSATLHLPQLPAYPTVLVMDLLWLAPLAVGAAAITVGAGRLAEFGVARIEGRVSAAGLLISGGLLIGVIAVVFRAMTDRPVDEVLFSGAGSLGEIVGETAALVLLVLLAAKVLAFVLTLIAGFRGGLIFPAVTIGVTLGALAAAVLPGLHLTPAIVAAMAASASAQLRAPFFGALMAALLAGQAITETMPIAVIAAAIGWLVAMRLAPHGPEAQAAAEHHAR